MFSCEAHKIISQAACWPPAVVFPLLFIDIGCIFSPLCCNCLFLKRTYAELETIYIHTLLYIYENKLIEKEHNDDY